MPIEPGTILASKYRVGHVIGTGGMGVVVSATHLELDQAVAIKLPLPEHAKDPTFAARFMREGRNVAKIRNDHVARVLDVGRDDAGNPFLVMELLEGIDLSQRVRQGRPFSIPEAIDLVMQACEAVAAAHAVGIVHRDLKPGNLFLEDRPDGWYHVKVLDFGISKVLIDDPAALEAALTNTTGIVGSPMYMSPEQMVAARDVDVRTDVWSLGLILYKILTNKTPWPSGNVMELATRIARDPPIPPRTYRPDLDENLEKGILRAIERDRDRRTATVYELAAALAPFDPGRGEASLRRIPRGTPGASSRRVETAAPAIVGSPESGTMNTSAITLHTAYDEPAPPVDATTIASESGRSEPTPHAPAPRRRSVIGVIIGLAVVAVASIAALIVVPRLSGTREPATAEPTGTNATTAKPTLSSSTEPTSSVVEPIVVAASATSEPAATSASTNASQSATTSAGSAPVLASTPKPFVPAKPPVPWETKPTATAAASATNDPWGKW